MNRPFFSALIVLLAGSLVVATGEANNEQRPVCSPDGSSLIYMLQSERTKNDWELYQLVFSTQTHTRLTNHTGWDGYAVWSADSRNIIYDREDTPGGQKRSWIMNMEDFTIKPLGKFEGWLSISDWSPDNKLLGFHELAGQRDLVVLDLDGNIVENLTDTADQSEHDAHFSPDGLKIAFANGAIDGAGTSLEMIDISTGNRTLLRTSIGRIYGISWSPDGDAIAFADAPGGADDDADIFIYHVKEQSFQQVTDDPAWDHMPEFCNNNHTLFFTSIRSGEERMYQVDPDPAPFLIINRVQKER